MIDRDDV